MFTQFRWWKIKQKENNAKKENKRNSFNRKWSSTVHWGVRAKLKVADSTWITKYCKNLNQLTKMATKQMLINRCEQDFIFLAFEWIERKFWYVPCNSMYLPQLNALNALYQTSKNVFFFIYSSRCTIFE